MSMPDKDRMRINRLRDLSPKTRKREQEIAEIKRKRQMRILEKEAEEVRKREREQGIFRQARAVVERRMAALKGGCGGGGGFLGGLDEEGGGGAGGGGAGGGGERMVPFDVSVVSVAPKRAFNLKRDAEHSVNKGAFDIERHVQMWKFTPKRKENVALALEFLELIFSDATSAVCVCVCARAREKGCEGWWGRLERVCESEGTYCMWAGWKVSVSVSQRECGKSSWRGEQGLEAGLRQATICYLLLLCYYSLFMITLLCIVLR